MIEQAKSQNPWKVLVVDDYALKVLSTATKLFDLASENISGNVLEFFYQSNFPKFSIFFPFSVADVSG